MGNCEYFRKTRLKSRCWNRDITIQMWEYHDSDAQVRRQTTFGKRKETGRTVSVGLKTPPGEFGSH